ncbi:hypothetical protein C7B62_01270 [Pleurocapsa sp. CCALA 161]|nr:hypothetical protein C7B62_01270 [Pleurocapsa sp. CCALA 161]
MLLVTRYLLLVTRYLLLVTRYSLLVTRYSLLVTYFYKPWQAIILTRSHLCWTAYRSPQKN